MGVKSVSRRESSHFISRPAAQKRHWCGNYPHAKAVLNPSWPNSKTAAIVWIIYINTEQLHQVGIAAVVGNLVISLVLKTLV